ncbi:methyltransferase domain-containing protein, partial [Proteus mirabilis]|nr:methyltransferase domain-containing protein [Proteus mirabilis]
NHMDIGVGTGFYLKRALANINKIALTDLNINSLDYAKKNIVDDKLTYCLQHDIYHKFPNEFNSSFDSISLFYLLHCLPGTMEGKKKVIENISKILTEKGVLYGSTILGADVEQNFFGNKLMSVYNKKG